MKVEIITSENSAYCVVTREKGDPIFSNGGWGSGESRLLYHVKTILNERGYNLIKKRMWKDNHLRDNDQQYVRAKRVLDTPNIAIYNDYYSICGAEEDFNKEGFVKLYVQLNIFGIQPNCIELINALEK